MVGERRIRIWQFLNVILAFSVLNPSEYKPVALTKLYTKLQFMPHLQDIIDPLANAQTVSYKFSVTRNPNPDGYKKGVAMRLGVICDSQATMRKQGGLPLRAPLPCRTSIGRLEIIHDSSRPKYTKMPPQTGGSSLLLIEKSPKTAFFIIKNL
jgi:hypothetical protein